MTNQPSREDFELEEAYQPLIGKSLEEIIADGESEWELQQEKDWVTLNSQPQWIHSVIINLKRRHKNVPAASAVERLVLKLGIAIIREGFSETIKRVEVLRQKIFTNGNQVSLMKSYKTATYQLQETVATTYRKCSIRKWIGGAITDSLVDPLGLSTSTAVVLTLMAGISASESWVPKQWKNLALKELGNFSEYLDNEAKGLEKIHTELSL